MISLTIGKPGFLKTSIVFCCAILLLCGCSKQENGSLPATGSESNEKQTVTEKPKSSSSIADDIKRRVENKRFPAIFQAWNPLDMPEKFPVDTLEQRLQNAAKHSLLWEEPVSQISFNTPLVLGLEWDNPNAGMATQFTQATLEQGRKNRARLLELNPNMVFLMEIRWRDAPGSYFPEDSEFWLRSKDGQRVAGWKGGPEPYYMLNFKHEGFQKRVAEQSVAAVASGVYDGVMLDWSGYLPIIKQVREALGDDGLIIVNIHDEIDNGEKYKDYINGSFMECGPEVKQLCSWEGMQKALAFFETEFLEPRINALELWGDRDNFQAMRAITTMGLTQSNAYILYADPNPLPTPDHLHDWYDFWDVDLGKPLGPGKKINNGAYERKFEKGFVIFNPPGNPAIEMQFNLPIVDAFDGHTKTHISLQEKDGGIYLE